MKIVSKTEWNRTRDNVHSDNMWIIRVNSNSQLRICPTGRGVRNSNVLIYSDHVRQTKRSDSRQSGCCVLSSHLNLTESCCCQPQTSASTTISFLRLHVTNPTWKLHSARIHSNLPKWSYGDTWRRCRAASKLRLRHTWPSHSADSNSQFYFISGDLFFYFINNMTKHIVHLCVRIAWIFPTDDRSKLLRSHRLLHVKVLTDYHELYIL